MKPPWEIEEAGVSAQPENDPAKFAAGDFVRRRGEQQVGQVRTLLLRLGKHYSVEYTDPDGTVYTRILSEVALLPAQQPTRFGGGSGH